MINFHPFQISVFYSLCCWFSIKFLKLYLVSVFLGAFISRVFQLILVMLLIVLCFYNKSRL